MAKLVRLRTVAWAFGKGNGKGFPPGFVNRVLREVYHGGRFLHVCCGPCRIPGAVNVDLRTVAGAGLLADATRLPFKTGSFDFVLADPPYPGYGSERLYGTPVIPLYSLLEEMSRVTAPGGEYALLYIIQPTRLGGDSQLRSVVVFLGQHMRPRVFSVFKRGMFPGMAAQQYRRRANKMSENVLPGPGHHIGPGPASSPGGR